MVNELEKLSASEVELLAKAPLLVCILIAGADNEIDNKEIRGAIALARKTRAKDGLVEFYKTATEDFEDKLKIILQSLPHESALRNRVIIKELSLLNNLLPKIEKTFSRDYYKSLRYIAKKIAESSGGLLGMKSVGDEELELMGLSMIKDPSI